LDYINLVLILLDIEKYALAHPKDLPAKISSYVLENLDNLKQGSKILDIGCAEGATIKFLFNRYGKKFEYTGIDLSKERIIIAKSKKIPNSNFIDSNGEDIPLKDSSYDCILCSQVLEHVEDENKLLSEIHRLLKPSRIFQIDTVFKKKWAWYFYRAPIGWAIDPTHLREYTDIEEVRNLVERNGLSVKSIHIERDTRNLKQIGLINLEIPIPGYYTLFIEGTIK